MYKLTVFRDLFGRFTLVCSFFYKIAEGPDSFCHHCIYSKKYTKKHPLYIYEIYKYMGFLLP